MKRLILILFLWVVAVAATSSLSYAQTQLRFKPISRTFFCQGYDFRVDYDVLYLQPGTKPILRLELSDSNGSFAKPIYLGQDTLEVDGGYLIGSMPWLPNNSSYFIRINSLDPTVIPVVADQKVKIEPVVNTEIYKEKTVYTTGEEIKLHVEPTVGTTYNWLFDTSAVTTDVGDSTASVTFYSPGVKQINLSIISPCGRILYSSTQITVVGCDFTAPASTKLLTKFAKPAPIKAGDTVWLTTDVLMNSNESGVVYLDSGASFETGGTFTIYAKHGSTVKLHSYNQLYVEPGVNLVIDKGIKPDIYECQDLNLDFSNVHKIGGLPPTQKVYCAGDTIVFEYRGSLSNTLVLASIVDEHGRELTVDGISPTPIITDKEIRVPLPSFVDSTKVYTLIISDTGKTEGLPLKLLYVVIKAKPVIAFSLSNNTPSINEPVTILNTTTDANQYHWEFGEGATPASYDGPQPPTVSYSTPGPKFIKLHAIGECGEAKLNVDSNEIVLLFVEPCTVIASENTLHIPPGKSSDDKGKTYIWVHKNGDYTPTEDGKIIYADSDSYVTLPMTNQWSLQAKRGAHVFFFGANPRFDNSVIYEDGFTFDPAKPFVFLHMCDDLSFTDLASVQHPSEVQFTVSPNPVLHSSRIVIDAPVSYTRIELYDMSLGRTVYTASVKQNAARKLSLDLPKDLPNGSYLLRLVGAEKPMEQKIILAR